MARIIQCPVNKAEPAFNEARKWLSPICCVAGIVSETGALGTAPEEGVLGPFPWSWAEAPTESRQYSNIVMVGVMIMGKR